MGTDMIETAAGTGTLSPRQMREQVNLIQQIMRDVMKGPTRDNPEGVHYGIIPGCKKPSLLKPGAEKLVLTFRLRPVMESGRDIITTDLGDGHREITAYCHIFNMGGIELATGVGSCSTMESKYRYRGGEKKPTGAPVPKDYWNLKKDGKAGEAQELIGGRGFGVAKVDGAWQVCELGEKQDNPDIADVYNTVLKMAKKRAYVDGVISATAASDIFTQDVEDTGGEVIGAKPAEDPVKMPQPTAVAAAAEPDGAVAGHATAVVQKITEKQATRFYSMWKKAGKTREQVMDYLGDKFGIKRDGDMPVDGYEEACAWAESR